MSLSVEAVSTSLTSLQLEWIDQTADRFEDVWRSDNEPPRICDFLGDVSGPQRIVLLFELVQIDMIYRARRGSERLIDSYLEEFPELDAVRLAFETDPHATTSHVTESSQRDLALNPPKGKDSLPQKIGRYRVVQKLGDGGQAAVYRAFDDQLQRDLAIKWSHQTINGDPQIKEALLAEGSILARLEQHPNLAKVFDCGMHEDKPFLAVEFIHGDNLESYARRRRMSPQSAAMVIAQVAEALEVVHRHHVVHQDIKPQNILMDQDRQPHLVDFGLSRRGDFWKSDLEQPTGGTPAYVSPEQARGEWDQVGSASDVFSLGGVLYFLLTGKAPFDAADALAALEKAARCDVDREALDVPTIPPRLRSICLKALGATPAERHGSALELANDLRGLVSPRRAWLVGGAGGVLLLLVGMVGVMFSKTQAVAPPQKQHLVQVLQREGDRVFTPKTPEQLQKLAPLQFLDRLQFMAESPAGFQIGSFCWTAERGLETLASKPLLAKDGLIRHQFPAEGSWRTPDSRGVTLVLFVADARREVHAEIVSKALSENIQPCPNMPPYVHVMVRRDEVEVFGETPRDDDFDRLLERLEQLRTALGSQFQYFWLVALPQK